MLTKKEVGTKLTVDYSIKPSLVNMEVESHPDRKDVVTYDLSKFERVPTLKSSEKHVSGHENLERLKKTGKILLDVRVLEELLKHRELIPEAWKTGYTYFWGTIFRGSDGDLCVPCLCWSGSGWYWDYGWPGLDWDSSEPAACLASS